MEVRCGSCNKLFRVSDDKITGTGVKFPCSRCGEFVKISMEDFEQYRSKSAAVPPVTPLEHAAALTAAARAAAAPPKPAPAAETGEPFDFGSLEAAPVAEAETPPPFVKPAPPLEQAAAPEPVKPKAETKKEPPVEPKTEPKPAVVPKATAAKPAPTPKPEPARAAAQPAAAPAAPPREPAQSAAAAAPVSVEIAAPAGSGKRTLVIIVLILAVLGGAAYGVKTFLGRRAQQASEAVKQLTSPDGLQITSATGAMDPANSDLVISGVIENTTDKPKPAWYVVAEVYDAQGGVLVKAKLLSGKQLYTKRDYEVLAKRGVNVQELRVKQVQEQGVIIPAKGAANFTIRVMEPPMGVASFNATLQPFDPVQLFKEIAEEQKQ